MCEQRVSFVRLDLHWTGARGWTGHRACVLPQIDPHTGWYAAAELVQLMVAEAHEFTRG